MKSGGKEEEKKRKRCYYELDGKKYTKTSAVTRMRLIKKELWKGRRVSILNTKHEQFIRDCFSNHPNYYKKTHGGKPIKDIYIDGANSKFQQYNVQVEGCYPPQNFGMPKCFMEQKQRVEQHLNLALRSEINGKIYEIRCSMPSSDKLACAYCHKRFVITELAVDHDVVKGKAFLHIKEAFLNSHPDANYASFEKEEHGMHQRFLKDRDLAKQWIEYHHKHAVYRLLCVTCNNHPENRPKKKMKK